MSTTPDWPPERIPPQPDHAPAVHSSTSEPPAGSATPRARQRRWIRPAAGALGWVVLGGLLGFGAAKVEWPVGSPFPAALTACKVDKSSYFDLGDKGTSLTIQSKGEEKSGADFADVTCVLDKLEMPDAVATRMDTTRALDGRQSAHWSDIDASWTYHPDNGMNLLLELSHR